VRRRLRSDSRRIYRLTLAGNHVFVKGVFYVRRGIGLGPQPGGI
jgi:hypothetical protein